MSTVVVSYFFTNEYYDSLQSSHYDNQLLQVCRKVKNNCLSLKRGYGEAIPYENPAKRQRAGGIKGNLFFEDNEMLELCEKVELEESRFSDCSLGDKDDFLAINHTCLTNDNPRLRVSCGNLKEVSTSIDSEDIQNRSPIQTPGTQKEKHTYRIFVRKDIFKIKAVRRDYRIWQHLEEKACSTRRPYVESLKASLIKAAADIDMDLVRAAIDDWRKLKACVQNRGAHFEQ